VTLEIVEDTAVRILTISSCHESRQRQSIGPITDRDVPSTFVADRRYDTLAFFNPNTTNNVL
jgi:hypothetical protein